MFKSCLYARILTTNLNLKKFRVYGLICKFISNFELTSHERTKLSDDYEDDKYQTHILSFADYC